jgi:ankyrin repeat protein
MDGLFFPHAAKYMTSRQLTVKHKVPKLIATLVRYGADVNATNHDGDPPLWLALTMQQFATAKLLVQAGCQTNFLFAETELTLLQRAVLEGKLPLVKFLLQSGANVNLHDNPEQASALHVAAGLGDQVSDIIRELVRAKADVNLQDVQGCTALHRCVCGSMPFGLWALMTLHMVWVLP